MLTSLFMYLFSVVLDTELPSIAGKVMDTVLGAGGTVAEAMTELGIGIASIFLLISVFKNIAATIEGGQFQSQMLLPLVLYMIICNFSIVTTVVNGYVNTVNTKAEAAVRKYKESQLDGKTSLQYYFENTVKNNPAAKAKLIEYRDKMKEEKEGLTSGKNAKDESLVNVEIKAGTTLHVDTQAMLDYNKEKAQEGDTEGGGWLSKLIGKLKDAIQDIIRESVESWQIWGKGNGAGGLLDFVENIMVNGASWFCALLMQWLVCIVSFLQTALGAIMIGVLIAFGPLTWAFALFPGNGKTIFTWFVRLGQFSLYGPLVYIVEAFNMALLSMTVNGQVTVAGDSVNGFFGGVFSAFVIIAPLAVNLVCLFSVPALATMIIEGAVGSVSLFANFSSALNVRTMIEQLGETSRDNRQADLLQQIVNNTGGRGGGGNGGGNGGGGIFGRPHS